MPLTKVVLKPGINRDDTRYAGEGGYYDCDRMRFRLGFPESIGGWVEYSPNSFLGSCTSIFPYSCSCGAKLVALGTHLKFYIEQGGVYNDITPIIQSSSLTSTAFTTNTGEPDLIQINDVNSEATVGSFVVISGVTGDINGVPDTELNGEHRVVSLGTNSFKISITTAPTSSGATGDATVDYQVPIGLPFYVFGGGWGAGAWSRSTWGSGVAQQVGSALRIWNVHNYGNAIVFGPRGGELYYWDFDNGAGIGQRGEAISSMMGANEVPLTHEALIVSDQRFVIVLGSNDYGGTDNVPMLVRWSDQENFLEWEPTAITQAGSQILTSGSYLVTIKNSKQELLVWSDTSLYSMQYQGPPFIYGFNLIGDNMSIAGPNAAIVVNGVAYWMGRDKFYVYSGSVQPLLSSVRAYVFDDFNFTQEWQVVAGANEEFNEVWWLYPSADSLFSNRYVVYNYQDQIWYYGTLDRTFWVDSALKGGPIATQYDPDTEISRMFLHEQGYNDGSVVPEAPINSYIETADFDIADGDTFSLVRRIIPDLTFSGSTNANNNANAPKVFMTLKPKRFSGSNYTAEPSNEVRRNATIPIEQYTEQVFTRVRGRQLAMRIECPSRGTKWRMGAPRIDVQPDGKK